MASRYEQMLAQVQQAISNYERAPGAFSDEDLKALQDAAISVGVNFEPQFSWGRAIKKGVFEVADTALLGILPNEWSPDALTTGERTAGTIGGLLGYAVPGAAAMKLGKAAVGVGIKAAGRTRLLPEVAGTLSGPAQALRSRITMLQRAVQSVKDPRLKQFYGNALMGAYKNIAVVDKYMRQGVATGARALGAAATRYPRATQYGVGIPAFLGMADMFEPAPQYGQGDYEMEEEMMQDQWMQSQGR